MALVTHTTVGMSTPCDSCHKDDLVRLGQESKMSSSDPFFDAWVPVLSPIQVSIIVEHPEDPSLHLELWESHCFHSNSTAQSQPLTPLFCPHISRDLPAHHMRLPYSMGRVQQMTLAHLGFACQALSG